MRKFLTLSDRWVKPAWVLPLALLALPNCNFSSPLVTPQTVGVFCDIHLALQRGCATDVDKAMGIRLSEAAIALAEGRNSPIGIDDSPEALARCNGEPEAVRYVGAFPQGRETCVVPNSFGPGHQFFDANGLCVSECLSLIQATSPPDPLLVHFCQDRAHVSTNMPVFPEPLFDSACTDGLARDDFADPRAAGQLVSWTNTIGVDPTSGDLVRNTPCTATPCSGFDAGAASVQLVNHGDGYLEFSVTERTTNRIGGLTTGFGADDHDPNFTTVGFGIDFFRDGCFYVFQSSIKQPSSNPPPDCLAPGAFDHYKPGDRFRITFRDKFDGTATIEYAKLDGPCTPGKPCSAPAFYTSPTFAAYPLHADAGFEDDGGALRDVRIVYIH